MLNKILILFAHPSQRRSEVNLPLITATKTIEGVTVPDFNHAAQAEKLNECVSAVHGAGA